MASAHPRGRLSMPSRMRRASSLNVAGQCASHGSGSKSAISTAREDANGRRAHHGCSVEGCPCRIDFSRAACCDTSAMGKSTSAKRLQDLGITLLDLATTGYGDGLAERSYRRTEWCLAPAAQSRWRRSPWGARSRRRGEEQQVDDVALGLGGLGDAAQVHQDAGKLERTPRRCRNVRPPAASLSTAPAGGARRRPSPGWRCGRLRARPLRPAARCRPGCDPPPGPLAVPAPRRPPGGGR